MKDDFGPFAVGEVVEVVNRGSSYFHVGDDVTINSTFVHLGPACGWHLKELDPVTGTRKFAVEGSVRRKRKPSWDDIMKLTGWRPSKHWASIPQHWNCRCILQPMKEL